MAHTMMDIFKDAWASLVMLGHSPNLESLLIVWCQTIVKKLPRTKWIWEILWFTQEPMNCCSTLGLTVQKPPIGQYNLEDQVEASNIPFLGHIGRTKVHKSTSLAKSLKPVSIKTSKLRIYKSNDRSITYE